MKLIYFLFCRAEYYELFYNDSHKVFSIFHIG